ncbi:spike base protein, RCAP_Rcc01079 family [Cupriavidus basilensis]
MPPNDKFAGYAKAITGPSETYFAITPHDTNDFAEIANSIRVGTGGDVVAVRIDGTPVLFKNCAAGEPLPIRARRVNATGTTATDLVGL